jgi:hypothetical protein
LVTSRSISYHFCYAIGGFSHPLSIDNAKYYRARAEAEVRARVRSRARDIVQAEAGALEAKLQQRFVRVAAHFDLVQECRLLL